MPLLEGLSLLGIFKGLITPVTTLIGGWQDRKKAKLDSDLKINEAKTDAQIKKIETGQTADIAWEQTSIERSGWKDEFWTILIAIPLIMSFIPDFVPHVKAGFGVLQDLPEWYRWALGIAIGSAFGVRRLGEFMRLKKGD